MNAPDIQLTDEFERCLRAVANGENVFITGKAGTGKSTVLRLICGQQDSKRHAIVAPTGVAALNVDGDTIHKCFAFRPELTAELRRYRPPKYLTDLEMLVIDEVSMAKADLVDMVDTSLRRAKKNERPFGGVQLVLVGDLFQLPPVEADDDSPVDYYATPFFFSSKAIGRTPLTTIELTSVFRQKDERFILILNAIRDGTVTEAALEELNRRVDPDVDASTENNSITLAARNAKVNEINKHRLAILPDPETVYLGEQEGEVDANKYGELRELRVKPGAQVMMLVNQHGYVNGSVGKIQSLSDHVISVEIEGLDDVIEVQRYRWRIFDPTRKDDQGNRVEVGAFCQFPMKLAWAVTVHKSQGKTFNRVIFDSSYSNQPGQTYVALSRCTSLEGLVLTNAIKLSHVKVSPHVLRFHRRVLCKTDPIDSYPKAFVGIVTTGNDRYRKLAEIAVIRHEVGKQPVAVSTLINPHRDLCDATFAGLAASEMTLCPGIAEARGIVAMMLSRAVLVGFRVDDLLELSDWKEDEFTEGVPYILPLTSSQLQAEGDPAASSLKSLDAMTLAQDARDTFYSLDDDAVASVHAAPFLKHTDELESGSYIFPRPLVDPPSLSDLGDLMSSIPLSTRASLAVAFSVGQVNKDRSAWVEELLEAFRVSRVDCEDFALRLFDSLVAKAEADDEITQAESVELESYIEVWGLSRTPPRAINNRAHVEIRTGMRVCLTGKTVSVNHPCHGWSKGDVMAKATPRGLEFTENVTKKNGPDIVALLDISQESNKAEKARKWGIPIVTWKDIVDWADDQ